MRVGAAQDLITSGLDMLPIMQAGEWKTIHVLNRYLENANLATLIDHACSRSERWDRVGVMAKRVAPDEASMQFRTLSRDRGLQHAQPTLTFTRLMDLCFSRADPSSMSWS